jgi:hypothetical protein
MAIKPPIALKAYTFWLKAFLSDKLIPPGLTPFLTLSGAMTNSILIESP